MWDTIFSPLSSLRWLGTRDPSHSRWEHPRLVGRNSHLLKGGGVAMETVFPAMEMSSASFSCLRLYHNHTIPRCFSMIPSEGTLQGPQDLLTPSPGILAFNPMSTSCRLFLGQLTKLISTLPDPSAWLLLWNVLETIPDPGQAPREYG